MAVSVTACFFGIAGITVLSLLMTIYVIKKSKQKKIAYSSNRPVAHDGKLYQYDPETKSIVESALPVSNDSNNSLRKRSPKVSSSASNSEKSNDNKDNLGVHKEVQTDFVSIPMSLEEKVDVYFRKQVPFDESPKPSDPENVEALSCSNSSSWSDISTIKSTDNSVKRYKKKLHKSLEKHIYKLIQENCEMRPENIDVNEISDTSTESDNLSTTTTSSNWSNISSEKSTDSFEKTYKKKVHKTFRKYVKNMSKSEIKAPTDFSDESENSSVVSLEDHMTCITCKVNPVNTRTKPCNHCYLCSDCAMKFFKYCKKCKACRAKINQYIVEE